MGRRLIDADAFDERIRLDVGLCEEELTEDFKDGISTILEMMKTAPTVDAVPVVHGHCIKFGVYDKDGNQQYKCSVCECEDIHYPLVKVNYCWNCGARMDGKDGEQHGR